MFKDSVITVTLLAFLNLTFGCTHTVVIAPEEALQPQERIIKLMKTDREMVVFARSGGHYESATHCFTGIRRTAESIADSAGVEGLEPEPYSVSADSVVLVWVQRPDEGRTILAVFVVAALVGAVIAIATADDEEDPPPSSSGTESCPFVYAFDGSQYVFDAEPLGGAVCRALQRSDYSRLEHLLPVDGQYRLKLTNEMPESQHLDRIQMYAVDHEPGRQIVPDSSGNMHLIRQAEPAAAAVDELGRDILPLVQYEDGISWQSLMTEAELLSTQDSRHHLTFEFAKPADARIAHVVFNAGTALWGSHMIREMMQARGSSIDQWYASVNRHGPGFWELVSFTFREELYVLKTYVSKDGAPVERGLIYGGGPLKTETRVAKMDVSDISGDKLILQLNPPKGFWTLDHLSVQYDSDTIVAPQRCEMSLARDHTGESAAHTLSEIDNSYLIMADVGDSLEMQFAVPPQAPGTERTVFLNTVGYYELHIDKSEPEQTELIDSVLRTPGAIAEYSTHKFLDGYRRLKAIQARP